MSRSIRSLLPLFLAALVGACGASGPDELKLGPQSSAVEIVPPGVAPIVHTSSSAAPFQQEPELFGYQPAFVPNTVSFDAGNRPYIREFARRPGAPCGAGDWDSAPVRATDSTGATFGVPAANDRSQPVAIRRAGRGRPAGLDETTGPSAFRTSLARASNGVPRGGENAVGDHLGRTTQGDRLERAAGYKCQFTVRKFCDPNSILGRAQ